MKIQVRALPWLAAFAALPLHAADEQLQEVTITATPLRTRVEDAIQPVVVLAGEDLHRQLTGSIGESIAKLPGVTGTFFGPQASRPVIRGFSGERVQMLEDGAGSLDVSSLSEDHAVSTEDLLTEQLELVKGPATLLYGSGAVGGVVNLLTRRIPESMPADAVSGALDLQGDSALGQRALVGRLELAGDSYALHADGFERRTHDYALPGGDSQPNTGSHTDGGAIGASWIGERGFAGVGFNRYVSNYGVPASATRIDMQQDRYEFRSELKLAPHWTALRVQAVHSDYQHAELESDGAIGTRFLQQGNELRISGDHVDGSLTGTVGLQARYLDFAAHGDDSFVPDTLARSAGAFAFERWVHGALTVEGGARLERQTIAPRPGFDPPAFSGDALSASTGLLWKYRPVQSLAVNITHSQRLPAAAELYADGPHEATQQFVIGDASMGAETARSFDVVWRGTGSTPWQLSGWASRFSDYIYLQPTGGMDDGLPVYAYRQGDARLYGIEAEVASSLWQRDGTDLQLRLLGDLVRGALRNGGDLPQMPPARVGAELSWNAMPWRASLSMYRYARQSHVAENETPTPGYTLLGIELGSETLLSRGKLSWFIKGSNLGDVVARRHTSPLKEIAPLPGRGVSAGLRLQL